MKKVESRNWYAIVSRPGREYVAARALEAHFGATCYIPTETRWRRRNRYCKSKEQIAYAVAPRYVLAGFIGLPPWLYLLDEPSVSDVIRLDGEPKRLDRSTAIFDRHGQPQRLTDEFLERFMARVPNGRLEIEPVEAKVNGELVAKMMRHRVVTDAMAPAEQQWMRTHREFSAGDVVEVVEGPFRDRRVTVLEINGQMARLDLELFGGAAVEVPVSMLEAA